MPYRTPPATPLGKLIISAREANIIETESGVRHAMTQQELADAMESTQQTISRWEAGRVHVPRDRFPALAVALGIDIEDLIRADVEGAKMLPQRPAPTARIDVLEDRVDTIDSKLDQILTLLAQDAAQPSTGRRRLAPVRAAKQKS